MRKFLKKNTIAVVASLAMAGIAFSGASFAQDDDDDGTIRLENVTIVSVVHVAFKPGKRARAMEIINEHFVTAGAAAGTPGPVYAIHLETGKWDMILAWEMEGGFDDLMWYRSPNDVTWFNALAAQEGGEEAAQALLTEYRSLVASRYEEVAHIHNPDDGGDE